MLEVMGNQWISSRPLTRSYWYWRWMTVSEKQGVDELVEEYIWLARIFLAFVWDWITGRLCARHTGGVCWEVYSTYQVSTAVLGLHCKYWLLRIHIHPRNVCTFEVVQRNTDTHPTAWLVEPNIGLAWQQKDHHTEVCTVFKHKPHPLKTTKSTIHKIHEDKLYLYLHPYKLLRNNITWVVTLSM